MNDWQPIETAPKDGTWVLLSGGAPDMHEFYAEDLPAPPAVVACWHSWPRGDGYKDGWYFCNYDGGEKINYMNPTVWMPVPTVPNFALTYAGRALITPAGSEG